MRTKLNEGRCSTSESVFKTLNSLGTLGSRLAARYALGDHRAVLSAVVNPSGYHCWQDFFRDYQSVSLLSKADFLDLGIDRKAVAMSKFFASEGRCRLVNQWFQGRHANFEEVTLLEAARSWVHRVLGKFSWDEVVAHTRYSGGAAVGVKRGVSHPWYKFGNLKPTTTGECLVLWNAFQRYTSLPDPGVHPEVIDHNKVTTVPKNAKSDRVIAIEPQLNMFFQLGIGGVMASRLRRFRINIRNQRRNQRLARFGSLTGRLATIDLSSASDSISRGLVKYLLPEDWWQALAVTRVNYALVDGEKVFLQKISSMGNGFTFPLETVIFYCFARAVAQLQGLGRRGISVYGDDIIVPSTMAAPLISALSRVGFATNADKTFVDGPFRESCGKHYFNGRDVTPLYIKNRVTDIESLFKLANGVRQLATRLGGQLYSYGPLKPVHDALVLSAGPRFSRLSVPLGFGDGGFLRNFDEVCPSTVRRMANWVEGYTTQVLCRKFADGPRQDGIPGLYVRLIERGAASVEHLPVPRQQYKHAVVRLRVPRWAYLPPWA